jgi:predicted transcriptional regulator
VPIGVGCKVCDRDGCPQRAFPQIGRTLAIDEHRSTFAPYPHAGAGTDRRIVTNKVGPNKT